jgi:autoinducer 2-degrading protein
MFAVFVTFDVKPDFRDVFVKRMHQQAEDSLEKEKDCGIFEVWLDSKTPNRVQLYEVYMDAAAFDIHLQSAHFKDFDATIGEMIVSKTISTFDQKLS